MELLPADKIIQAKVTGEIEIEREREREEKRL
jgi:hypothetical protein